MDWVKFATLACRNIQSVVLSSPKRLVGTALTSASDSGLHILPLPKVGQELGRFLIEKELPRGGQARVYRAWQLDLQRPVALKLLPSGFASDQEAITRFRREIENVAKISHPNVVHVYEAGEIEGHAFFTMEFIEGEDLESRLKKGVIGPDEAAAMIEAVARGVQEAHRNGIVHRDIKPGNIILRTDGTPVLTDFGLAQDLRQSNALTQTGVSMGTPAYMSPEQARGERQRVGKRSDVYALGATLYSLLTGKRPVDGESAYELMVKVAESQGPRWSREAREDVPADLRAIVELAMQNDPGKRYDSATDLADELERFLRGDWVVARSRGPLARLWARSRRYVPAAAVLLLAAGVAAGMVYSGMNVPEPEDPSFGRLIDERALTQPLEKLNEAEFTKLFESTWTKSGATVRRVQGDELLATRDTDAPMLISPNESACWGDFTLQMNLSVRKSEGPLLLLVGMPQGGSLAETAYTVALGQGSRESYVLFRLGVPVLSGQRFDGLPLTETNRWYNASVTRRAQNISFALQDLVTGANVASFEFEDEFPALLTEQLQGKRVDRQRFGIRAHAEQLGLRNVTVSHTDHRYATEDLLFSVGQFFDVEQRVNARLGQPLESGASPAQRAERARLLYLRARCRERLGQPEAALEDCAELKVVADDADLRARAFLLSSRLETLAGNDDAALAQLRVARLTTFNPVLQMRVFHEAWNHARDLRAQQPQRALLYYDYVSNNALGTPALVCGALLESAKIRLDGTDVIARQQARAALRRASVASYRRFGQTFPAAVTLLFEERWKDLLQGAAPQDGEVAAGEELPQLADWLASSADGYDVDNEALVPCLLRATWLLRLSTGPLGEAPQRWLEAVRGNDLWAQAARALMAQERPRGISAESRVEAWRAIADQLKVDDPGQGALAAICDFFIGMPIDDADARRREDVLRRVLRRDISQVPAWWRADADADHFVDYLAALACQAKARGRAATLLEKAAAGDTAGAGVLRLLRGKANEWLPVEG